MNLYHFSLLSACLNSFQIPRCQLQLLIHRYRFKIVFSLEYNKCSINSHQESNTKPLVSHELQQSFDKQSIFDGLAYVRIEVYIPAASGCVINDKDLFEKCIIGLSKVQRTTDDKTI